jgi:hypothetical protein
LLQGFTDESASRALLGSAEDDVFLSLADKLTDVLIDELGPRVGWLSEEWITRSS